MRLALQAPCGPRTRLCPAGALATRGGIVKRARLRLFVRAGSAAESLRQRPFLTARRSETESTRDAQRVRDRDRPRRRPPGRRAGSHGAPDPPGRPGGRVPPARPRRSRPALRAAAGPLPARPGPGDGLRHGLPRGVRAPGRAGHRRAGLAASSTASTGSPATTTSSSSSARTSPTRSSPTSWRSTPGSRTSSAPSVIPVVGGRKQTAESVRAETRNAYRAYDGLGCDVLAMVVNRVAPADRAGDTRAARQPLSRCPCYVLPDEPALSAPTVAQITQALGGKVLLGDDAGLARDALDFVFGGAMLPNFLKRADPGLPGRHPRRPRRPRGGRARRAQRRHPADRGRPAHPERAARATRSSPSPPVSRPARRWSRSSRLLPHRGRTLRPGREVERRDAPQGGDGARPLRAVRGHRPTC